MEEILLQLNELIKNIFDFIKDILNTAPFGVVIGLFASNFFKRYYGKVEVLFKKNEEEFSKEQFPDGKLVDKNNFIIDVINNKEINVVIYDIKLIKGNIKYTVFHNKGDSKTADPIILEPHQGHRYVFNAISVKPDKEDEVIMKINGKERKIKIT